MTIGQTIEIPASRRVTIEVPPEVPVGATIRLELVGLPRKELTADLDATLKEIRELCKDSSVTVDSFLEMRRQELEFEERKYRRFFPEGAN